MAKQASRTKNPDAVRDEAIAIPIGQTTYTIDLDEATVDQLALGLCPETLAQRMHELLRWRRDAYRQQARDRAFDAVTDGF